MTTLTAPSGFPTKMGELRVETVDIPWVDDHPYFTKDALVLPVFRDGQVAKGRQFFLFDEGKQFLFTQSRGEINGEISCYRMYLGGFLSMGDEKRIRYLVSFKGNTPLSVCQRMFELLQQGDEVGFWGLFKPGIITQVEQVVGKKAFPAQNVWVLPLPWAWSQIATKIEETISLYTPFNQLILGITDFPECQRAKIIKAHGLYMHGQAHQEDIHIGQSNKGVFEGQIFIPPLQQKETTHVIAQGKLYSYNGHMWRLVVTLQGQPHLVACFKYLDLCSASEKIAHFLE